MDDIERILVAVDGSANAHRAVDWTAAVASRLGARVVAVHALGLLLHVGDRDVVPAQQHRQETCAELEHEWCTSLVDAGVSFEAVVRDGSPVDVVLSVAGETGADLIVLGSRGLGGYPELLLGSTSTQVAQRSSVPVVIVPGAPEGDRV